MSNDQQRPILTNGEAYIVPHRLENGMPKEDKRPSFDVARHKLGSEIKNAIELIDKMPKELIMDEIIINLKMDVDYSAKSYHPLALISQIDADDVGSKKWIKEVPIKNGDKPKKIKIGKEIFLRVKRDMLENLEKKLIEGSGFSKSAKDNIRSIESLYFDNHSSFLDKFEDNWVEGRVELVIHSFDAENDSVKARLIHLIEQYDGDISKVKIKTYDSGITFVSAVLSRQTLSNVLSFNPIRTAHPIFMKALPTIRAGESNILLPQPPVHSQKSSIKIGVFDGGVNVENPYFSEFVVENNPVSTSPNAAFLKHGTGVVGASLYGDLSKYGSKGRLPTPVINVESFRVFPLNDSNDIDLYEVIDIIEDIVPKRPDIQVYNLSIGPYGAIDDDNISRFTYAIDELSKTGKKLFVVAVGNDGDLDNDELCRIQAPADAVNCLGIGAYSRKYDGGFERADYSSYGDGREGCKIEPDFLDFGGSHTNPFQLIDSDGITRNFSCGTSFSTPLVTAKAAEIIGRCNLADPLLARALLVHTAKHPENKADRYMGHGIANPTVDDILLCNGNSVTAIYQSRLRPTQAIKLPFPYIEALNYKGKVVVEWTIALSSEVDAKNTEDYTLSCIEDTFYPHEDKYRLFKTVDGKKKTQTVNVCDDEEIVRKMLEEGWGIGNNPNTYSAFSNKYKTEEERKKNFKWDTVIKRRAAIKYQNLKNPYIVLHAMERYNHKSEFVNYAVVVTLNYVECKEDVYNLTLKAYNKLEVASIRSVNEILVK